MNEVIIKEQAFDLDKDAIKIGEFTYVKKAKVIEMACRFCKKLIDEGKLAIVAGHEAYFDAPYKDITE